MEYNFTEHTTSIGQQALQGAITGDIYQIGRLQGTNPDTTFLIRYSDPSTITWSQYYSNVKLSYRSICIDLNETFIYSLQNIGSTSYTFMYSFHTENGTVGMTKRMHSSI